MHSSAYSFVASLIEKVTPYGVVRSLRGLDIGGANVNGTARDMFHHTTWDVLDKEPGKDVTIVGDASEFAGQRAYDVVLCTEVLEHSPDWADIVRNGVRALDRNGHFILTCAATGRPRHGADGDNLKPGEYYGNIEPRRLHKVLLEFDFLIWRNLSYFPEYGDLYFYGVRTW